MDLELDGRRAVVMGASRGLGRAIASAFAAEGAHVTAVARTLELLTHLASECAPGTVTPLSCDLSDTVAVQGLEKVLRDTDILVLNGGGPPPGSAIDTTDAVWIAQFNTMFLSAVRIARVAIPGMRKRRYGRILIVVSSGVIQPIPNLVVSNSLRLALVGWAKTLANEVAADGVTVNCLAPGRIATDRVAALDQSRASREGIAVSEVERQSRALIPMGRYGEAVEFASIASFLASPRASYITGSILRVDGGMLRNI